MGKCRCMYMYACVLNECYVMGRAARVRECMMRVDAHACKDVNKKKHEWKKGHANEQMHARTHAPTHPPTC